MGTGLLAWRFVCIGPGGLRLQPPALRAGWGGGGRTGAQSALALAELGNGEGGQEAGGAELRGGCINREGGTCIPGWVRGGRSAQRKWKVCSAGRPGPGIRVRTCRAGGAGGPPTPSSPFLFFFCKREGGCCWYRPLLLLPPGVKVQEEVQPLPSFLRSEHTEPGAAAPPLRRRLRPARERATLPPPPSPARSSLRRRHRPPGFGSRPALPSPCAPRRRRLRLLFPPLRRPRPGSRFAGDAARAPSGLGKSRGRPLLLLPPLLLPARAPLCCAPAPPGGREGRWQARFQEGRTSLLACPPEVDREGEAGGRRGERSARFSRGGGSYVVGGAPCRLDSPIQAGGVCAPRTCETTEPRAGTCGECRHVLCARLLAA